MAGLRHSSGGDETTESETITIYKPVIMYKIENHPILAFQKKNTWNSSLKGEPFAAKKAKP